MYPTVKLFKDSDARIGADIVLKARLYVSGWALSGMLKECRAGRKPAEISLVYIGDVPVAVCMLDGTSLNTFVRKSQRRRGYGTLAARALIGSSDSSHFRGYMGSVQSEQFYRKLGTVFCY